MLRLFYNGFDGIVANSDSIADRIRSLGVRTPIELISNGVDLDQFRPRNDHVGRDRARRALGRDPSQNPNSTFS